MAQRYFVGTELKFAITINCEGFSMTEDPWTVTVKNGTKSIECEKVEDDNNQYYFLLDTATLGKGTYEVTVEIDVPDEDFPAEENEDTHYRHEVWKKVFITVK